MKLRFSLALLLCFSLIGCSIEGGAPVGQPTVQVQTPLPTTNPATSNLWTLGLTEEPVDLYPYSYAFRGAAPLIELLYPAPLTVVAEAYTTTGVLERVPSFENGDVQYITTTVNLDANGVITTTQTEIITSVRQLTVTYRWNKNLQWEDGQPLTAADSVFAYNLLRGSASTAQLATQSDLTADYVALDQYTTRAYLPPERDDPNYLITVWTPLPAHLFEGQPSAKEVSDRLGQSPVGYGAYTLKAWTAGTQLEFVRREGQSAQLPSTIIARLYPDIAMMRDDVLSGRVDVAWTEGSLEQLALDLKTDVQSKTLQLLQAPNPIWEHIDMNLAVVALQDIRMRQAIAHGFDREAISTTLYGTPKAVLHSWLAAESWAFDPTTVVSYTFDPALSRQLLDEMNYRDTNGDGLRERPDGTPFQLTLTTSAQTPIRQRLSEQFVSDMQAIGIDIKVEALSTTDLYSQQGPLFGRRFELALFGWLRSVDPDGAVLWSCAAIPNQINGYSGDNFTGWCMDTADRAIRTATSSLDPAVRKAAYSEQQQIFTRELPVLPVITRQTTVLLAPKVRGVQPQPLAPITWNVGAWQR